jgi:putative salt-induced outer membrane protein YdiY
MTSHLTTLYRYVLPTGLLAATLLASLSLPTLARADEGGAADTNATAAVKEPPKPQKWDGNVTAGVTLTRGNSKNFLASGVLSLKRTWTDNEALLGASAGYGDNTTKINGTNVTTTTDSYVRGFGQFNHLFTPRLYAGLRVTGEHDDIAALAYRLTVSPLAGYYFVKQTNAFLAAEIGPSYVREKFFDQPVDDYLGLRLGERGEYKFKGGAKIWETLEYIPKIEDFSNYLLNAEAGVSAPLTKTLSLSLVLQDTYKSVPANGKLKNDLKLIAGLTYTF